MATTTSFHYLHSVEVSAVWKDNDSGTQTVTFKDRDGNEVTLFVQVKDLYDILKSIEDRIHEINLARDAKARDEMFQGVEE